MVSGPGLWIDDVLVGPLPLRSLDAARSRPWGSIDGIDELPLAIATTAQNDLRWVSAGAVHFYFFLH